MLSANDWQMMRDLAAKVRTDRSFDVEFRRGESTLDAQEVRIEAVGRGFHLQSDAAREARVAVEDRFTVDGVLYRVVSIAPNRDIDTQAEAVAVE